jgi:hypothetical protein
LLWEYHYDTAGRWTSHRRQPKPSYWLHCFVVARSARQFFEYARFDPGQPVADENTYRRLIRKIVSVDPRRRLPESERIVIPGYADLRMFSQAHEASLKRECGGAWQSYVQRGNWRMIFPFTRGGQERMASQVLSHLKDHPVLAHVVRFPSLSINHSVLIYDATNTPAAIQFVIYDPNRPALPATLDYDRASRTFNLPPNNYFPGGRVDVYETCHKWDY